MSRKEDTGIIRDAAIGLVGIVGCVAAIIAVIVALVSVPSYYASRAECNYASNNTGAETKFVKNHLLSWDCYVKVDQQWIPIERWRGDSDD